MRRAQWWPGRRGGRRTGRRTVPDPVGSHLEHLLRGGSLVGEGAYNGYDSWWASLGPADADSPAGRLVTVHEALHAGLNDCTAYGIGLAAVGVLSGFSGRGDALARLVGMCRTTHEAYATFGSLWLVSDGDLELLGGRPDYRAWYRDAAELVPLPDGARRTQIALDEAARVSMQSGALDDLLVAGLDGSRPTIARSARPDVRFGWLHELADAGFWDRTWARCAAADLPGWDLVVAADTDADARDRTYADEVSATCSAVAEIVYAELAGLLDRRGARTLGYDDHQLRTAQVIAEVERLVPEAAGLLRASTGELPSRLESFEVWSRERLVVRDRPRPARLHRIEDRPPVGLLSEHRGRSHVFCIARPAFRLRRQFAFSIADDATLEASADQPVVAVVSADEEGVDLVVLSRPEHLRMLADEAPGAVLLNVTLSALGATDWRDRWAGALAGAAVTGLIDLVPLRQFDAWRDDGGALRYAVGTISGGRSGSALFACELDDGGLRLLLPCTHVTADVLAEYLDRHFPRAELTAAVFDGVRDLVEITMSQLMSIDQAFDVSAYYQPPGGPRGA